MNRKQKIAYKKLLDAWTPNPESGDPIGCITTTYTFSASFFEEECLARFLQMETDPRRDAKLYYIEREEKLSGLVGVSVFVDRDHCSGKHNLRWDIIPVNVPGNGRLHSKISILIWEKLVRVIVASANLTETGYRLNFEVFGVLDFNTESELSPELLVEILSFLRKVSSYSSGYNRTDSAVHKRLIDQINWIESFIDESLTDEKPSSSSTVSFIPTGPGYPDLFTSLRDNWPSAPFPSRAWVFSPFFDENYYSSKDATFPSNEIWSCLKKRNAIAVNYLVDAELIDDEGKYHIHAPEYLKDVKPQNRSKADLWFSHIDLTTEDHENRPYHAKGIWLEDSRFAQYLIGSSNFTRPGTGLKTDPNIEANLLYVVNRKDKSAYRNLDSCFPVHKRIPYKRIASWSDKRPDAEDESRQYLLLPPFFDEAVYDVDDKKKGILRLHFTDAETIEKWEIRYRESEGTRIYCSEMWKADKESPTVELSWEEPAPPTGLHVYINGEEQPAWWPVNVESVKALPPVEDLVNLPLSVLIDFLTSSRPLHHVMDKYLREKDSVQVKYEQIVDVLKQVDTSGYLLQRTRRISWALTALREKLEQPVHSQNGLDWRLHGPLGVEQVHRAILNEAKSNKEKLFLSTELALELSRFSPSNNSSVPTADVRRAIGKVIGGIVRSLKTELAGQRGSLADYVRAALKEMAE